MAALISGVLATGTTVVIAPDAAAADQMIVEAYQKLDDPALHQFKLEQEKLQKTYFQWNQATKVLPDQAGPGLVHRLGH